MNKKILICGSIIAVVILVLASFSSVIGVQTRTISYEKTSPLFSIRTKRAIREESKTATIREYFGKGKESTVLLPTLNDKNALFISRIQRMDDETFDRFIALVINKLHYEAKLKDVGIDEIVTRLHQIREDPQVLRMLDSDESNQYFETEETEYTCEPRPLCWVFAFFSLILFIIFYLFATVFVCWVTIGGPKCQTTVVTCDPSCPTMQC